jgi:hypothetical protein
MHTAMDRFGRSACAPLHSAWRMPGRGEILRRRQRNRRLRAALPLVLLTLLLMPMIPAAGAATPVLLRPDGVPAGRQVKPGGGPAAVDDLRLSFSRLCRSDA